MEGVFGIISAQENLDKREDNKGVSIKSPAFIQPCFLMERQNSSKQEFKNQLLVRSKTMEGGTDTGEMQVLLLYTFKQCLSLALILLVEQTLDRFFRFRGGGSCRILRQLETQRGCFRFVFGRRFMSERVSVDGGQHVVLVGRSVGLYRLIALSASALISVWFLYELHLHHHPVTLHNRLQFQ